MIPCFWTMERPTVMVERQPSNKAAYLMEASLCSLEREEEKGDQRHTNEGLDQDVISKHKHQGSFHFNWIQLPKFPPSSSSL